MCCRMLCAVFLSRCSCTVQLPAECPANSPLAFPCCCLPADKDVRPDDLFFHKFYNLQVRYIIAIHHAVLYKGMVLRRPLQLPAVKLSLAPMLRRCPTHLVQFSTLTRSHTHSCLRILCNQLLIVAGSTGQSPDEEEEAQGRWGRAAVRRRVRRQRCCRWVAHARSAAPVPARFLLGRRRGRGGRSGCQQRCQGLLTYLRSATCKAVQPPLPTGSCFKRPINLQTTSLLGRKKAATRASALTLVRVQTFRCCCCCCAKHMLEGAAF